jgi:hypothetical protein
MQFIKQILGLNACCWTLFLKKKCENIISIINIGLLYYFGLQIYNYSYGIGYNFTNSVLYIDYTILAPVIMELLQLLSIIFTICFWCAIYPLILDNLDCKCASLV